MDMWKDKPKTSLFEELQSDKTKGLFPRIYVQKSVFQQLAMILSKFLLYMHDAMIDSHVHLNTYIFMKSWQPHNQLNQQTTLWSIGVYAHEHVGFQITTLL